MGDWVAVASLPVPLLTGALMEKVYTLPDLPLLPYSDTQALLRQLLEYRDFSVLPALFDALKEGGYAEEIKSLRAFCGQYIFHSDVPCRPCWRFVVEHLVESLWDLLYTPEAVVSVLSDIEWRNEPEPESPPMGFALAQNYPYTAEGDIPAGTLVILDNEHNTVRIHPNPPTQ